jgi:hypothetical protein
LGIIHEDEDDDGDGDHDHDHIMMIMVMKKTTMILMKLGKTKK